MSENRAEDQQRTPRGTPIDVYVGGEKVEQLYLKPGDSYEAEIHSDDVAIVVPEEIHNGD